MTYFSGLILLCLFSTVCCFRNSRINMEMASTVTLPPQFSVPAGHLSPSSANGQDFRDKFVETTNEKTTSGSHGEDGDVYQIDYDGVATHPDPAPKHPNSSHLRSSHNSSVHGRKML